MIPLHVLNMGSDSDTWQTNRHLGEVTFMYHKDPAYGNHTLNCTHNDMMHGNDMDIEQGTTEHTVHAVAARRVELLHCLDEITAVIDVRCAALRDEPIVLHLQPPPVQIPTVQQMIWRVENPVCGRVGGW